MRVIYLRPKAYSTSLTQNELVEWRMLSYNSTNKIYRDLFMPLSIIWLSLFWYSQDQFLWAPPLTLFKSDQSVTYTGDILLTH